MKDRLTNTMGAPRAGSGSGGYAGRSKSSSTARSGRSSATAKANQDVRATKQYFNRVSSRILKNEGAKAARDPWVMGYKSRAKSVGQSTVPSKGSSAAARKAKQSAAAGRSLSRSQKASNRRMYKAPGKK